MDGYARGAPVALCHPLDLLAEIDLSKVSARLADGFLRLELPKVLLCIDGSQIGKWKALVFSLDKGHGQKVKRRTHHEH